MNPMPNPMLTGYPGAMPQNAPAPQAVPSNVAAPAPGYSPNSFIDKFKAAMDAINSARGAGTATSPPQIPTQMPAHGDPAPVMGLPPLHQLMPPAASPMAGRHAFDDGGAVKQPVPTVDGGGFDLPAILKAGGQMIKGFGAGVVNPFHITSSIAKNHGYPAINDALSGAMRDAPISAGAGQGVGLGLAALGALGVSPAEVIAAPSIIPILAHGGAGIQAGASQIDKGGPVEKIEPGRGGGPQELYNLSDVFAARDPERRKAVSDFNAYWKAPKTPMSYPDDDQAMAQGGWGAMPRQGFDIGGEVYGPPDPSLAAPLDANATPMDMSQVAPSIRPNAFAGNGTNDTLLRMGLNIMGAAGQRDAHGLPMNPLGAIGSGAGATLQQLQQERLKDMEANRAAQALILDTKRYGLEAAANPARIAQMYAGANAANVGAANTIAMQDPTIAHIKAQTEQALVAADKPFQMELQMNPALNAQILQIDQMRMIGNISPMKAEELKQEAYARYGSALSRVRDLSQSRAAGQPPAAAVPAPVVTAPAVVPSLPQIPGTSTGTWSPDKRLQFTPGAP